MTRQTTVLEAMARYKWLGLFIVIGFAGLGFLFGLIREQTYEAAATLVLEEPTASSLVEPEPLTQRQFGQYLAEQEELLRSVTTAERAAEIAAEEDSNTELTAEGIWEDVSTTSDIDSGFVDVFLLATSADDAVLGVNSLVAAYEDVRLEQIRNRADTQLSGIDAALDLLEQDIQEVQGEIAAVRPPERDQLDAQLEASLAELVALHDQREQANTEEQLQAVRTELDDVFAELQTSQLYRSLEAQQPELAPLLRTESDLLDLEQELVNRRQLVQIERELADAGIVLVSPARRAFAQGIGIIPLTIVLAVLGIVVAGFIAYFLALRRERVTSPRDPELVLESPLLTEIPDFADERIHSELPVEEHPDSSVAESFRFLASSLVVRRMSPGRTTQTSSSRHVSASDEALANTRVFVVVSAAIGDGKTTVVANSGLAAARAGNRVLLIDADFGAQQLTTLFSRDLDDPGITDAVLRRPVSGIGASIETVDQAGGGRLDIMGRGRVDVTAGTFFRSEGLPSLLDELRGEYDVVLIDTPPLLQVAYAGLVASLADDAIVVVRHDSDMVELEEVRDRLDMTGTAPMGYAYNGAPLRRRLTGSESSLSEEGFQP